MKAPISFAFLSSKLDFLYLKGSLHPFLRDDFEGLRLFPELRITGETNISNLG